MGGVLDADFIGHVALGSRSLLGPAVAPLLAMDAAVAWLLWSG